MQGTRTTAVKVVTAGLAMVLVGVGVTGRDDAVHGSADVRSDRGGGGTARNVIVVVGDGMGDAQRELVRLGTVGRDGELEMDLRFAGWTRTDSADPEEAVTDSAAGATAFATGVRTYNGAIAVDGDGNPVRTLLERAAEQGRATGLVTTAQVTDSTPAAFAAHVPDRADQSDIARQYLHDTEVDVILGGGEDWWYPAGDPGEWPDHPPTDPAEESRGTGGDLVAEAERLGYQYVSDAEELAAADGDKVLGLFANEKMFDATDLGGGAGYAPAVPLPVMAAKALDVLSDDPDGFFLVLEEEGIDEMAHHARTGLVVEAGRALDQTVALARDFAAEHGGTLIVVVGDHETGGLTIDLVDPQDESGAVPGRRADGPFHAAGTELTFTVDWATDGHTGAATPATAEGPGASAVTDVVDNTDIHDLVLDAMGGPLDRAKEEQRCSHARRVCPANSCPGT